MSDPQATLPGPDLPSPWWSEQRQALLDQARRFAWDEVLPVADELDPVKGEMPPSLLKRLGELGYFGLMIPASDGGMGLGVFEYCLVAEELARAWLSVGSILARAQGLGTNVPDRERRSALIAKSARGEWIGAVSLSEPDAGSDLAAISTRAQRVGDHFVLTGRKRWAGNALAADFIQMLCRERDPEPGESRSAGLVTLLLEKTPGEFPEGMTGYAIDKIGYHGFRTWELLLEGVKVPVENVLSDEFASAPGAPAQGSAFRKTEAFLNVARVHTAARAVGLARAAVEDTAAYLAQRRQFGHPIGDFQAVRFELADLAAQVDQARAHYRQVAHLMDEGRPCAVEAAMVKLQSTEMAVRVTNAAMQLHGGNGYTTEHRVERYWRDARLTTIFEGTSEIQKRSIANALLGRSPLG